MQQLIKLWKWHSFSIMERSLNQSQNRALYYSSPKRLIFVQALTYVFSGRTQRGFCLKAEKVENSLELINTVSKLPIRNNYFGRWHNSWDETLNSNLLTL